MDNIEKPEESAGPPAADASGGERTHRIVTLPNALCVVRLLGSFVLVALAVMERSEAFLWLFIVLALTDWLDGKLAILLKQRSVLGARLDSWADAALYAALLFGAIWLHGEALQASQIWIFIAVASYAISTIAGLIKYRRWPSYHTRAAKVSWFLIAVGVVCFFAEWAMWPLQLAALAITFTNLEAVTITLLSANWCADVESVFHVLRQRRRYSRSGAAGKP